MALTPNTFNTAERLSKGKEAALAYVEQQIQERAANPNIGNNKDVVAILEDHDEYGLGKIKVFPNDIILATFNDIAEAGYFIWGHTDYMGYHCYYVTKTTNCPHPYFHRVR